MPVKSRNELSIFCFSFFSQHSCIFFSVHLFHSFFLHAGVGFLCIVFVKSGATESRVDISLLLKLSTIKLQGAGKISVGVLCKIPMKFSATSEVR